MPDPEHTSVEAAWMAAALEEARRAGDEGEVPVGAVVVLDGHIIGTGHNTTEAADDPAGHAEINALRDAGAAAGDWRLEESILVVTLEPCAMCMGAIALARVRRLIYGARDPRLGACGSALDLADAALAPHLRSVEGGLMAEECSALIKDFFKALR
ncbi:MAG: tRNA adenosine(34) deaminase TadA [Acidobacteriota bacterium]|jgi:tRNA(adenine34) deaminase